MSARNHGPTSCRQRICKRRTSAGRDVAGRRRRGDMRGARAGAADVLARGDQSRAGARRRRRLVAEDLGFEHADLGVGVVPGVGGQAGLAAGRGQELLAVEAVLDRDLGQQQAARAAPAHVQTVTADLDLLGAMDEDVRRQHRDLDGHRRAGRSRRWAGSADRASPPRRPSRRRRSTATRRRSSVPMQPRSAPPTCSVTNAAPGAASAGARRRVAVRPSRSSSHRGAVALSRPTFDSDGGARVLEQQAPKRRRIQQAGCFASAPRRG